MSDSQLVIRPARTSDIKAIRSIIDTYVLGRRLLAKETVTLYETVQEFTVAEYEGEVVGCCLLYTSPSPRDRQKSRMPSSA